MSTDRYSYEGNDHPKWDGLVKKAQRRVILRNLGITFIAILILLMAGSQLNHWLIDDMRGTQEIATSNFNTVSAPNRYLGKASHYYGFLKGHAEVSTYKLIGGRVVATEELSYSYGLLQDYYGDWTGSGWPEILSKSYDEKDTESVRYNVLGQREMFFYYPFIVYQSYRNDLQLLNDMASDELVEVALSLDGYYSLDEISDMFPADMIAWYWLDDLSEEEKEAAFAHESLQQTDEGDITHEYSNRVRSERTAYGVKAYSENGNHYDTPLKYFNWAVQKGSERDTRFRSEFERLYQDVCGGQELTEDNVCFGGLVVSGTVEELLMLLDHPQVKGSALGVATSEY
jgi:hypothetical protein